MIKPEKIQGKEAGNIRSSPDQSVFEVVLKFNPLFGILFCFVFFSLYQIQIELLLCSGSVLDAGYGVVKKHGRVFVPGQLF